MLKLIYKAPHFFIFTIVAAFVFAANAQTAQTTPVTEPVESRSNLQIVKDMYGSFAIGDVPAVVADMDKNIEWNESENFPYADGNPYIGPDAVVKGIFSRLGSEWDYWRLTDQVYYESQNGEILVTGRYNAKHKKTGKEINAQFVHIFWIENGKVIKFQQYADTHQVNSAMQ
jgi:ketosteroid isomerase-like protein